MYVISAHKLVYPYLSITGDYTALDTDVVIGVNAAANMTITLPTANDRNGKVFIIKRLPEDNGGFSITITSVSNIEGHTDAILQKETSLTIMSTGSEWIII